MSSEEADVVLEVEGMMCQNSCAATVRDALLAEPGVRRAEVSHPQREARFWWQTDTQSESESEIERVVREMRDNVESVGCDVLSVTLSQRSPPLPLPPMKNEHKTTEEIAEHSTSSHTAKAHHINNPIFARYESRELCLELLDALLYHSDSLSMLNNLDSIIFERIKMPILCLKNCSSPPNNTFSVSVYIELTALRSNMEEKDQNTLH